MNARRFGVSTHLYHDRRLGREHLLEIAAHGFEAVEVFATPSHFDYHDQRAIADLGEWLRDAGLRLHGIHAPIAKSLTGERWGPAFTNATIDEELRQEALREAEAALTIARAISTGFLTVHLGKPASQKPSAGDNNRDAARRSVEEIHRRASPLGVRVALEVIPNELSTAASLVRLLEEELDLPDVGICLDFGHAFLMGDLIDAIELVSGHLMTTHVHDNRGKTDDHLAPFDGAIDWSAALTAVQKIGYEGVFLLELANTGTPAEVLAKARKVQQRFELILGA